MNAEAPTAGIAARTAPHEPRIVVFTAPSGAGKTTIARRVMAAIPALRFSVSATNRPRRAHERDGVDYHFVSDERFRQMAANGELLEWEEVYPGRFYGTPHAEVARATRAHPVLLDIDVRGALNVKRLFGDDVLTIFIRPPSLEALSERLYARNTETEETLRHRLTRAADEITYADRFDAAVVNEHLEEAVAQATALVRTFLAR